MQLKDSLKLYLISLKLLVKTLNWYFDAMSEQKNKSPHILNTSATLMGLCFVVLTSLNINSKVEESIIDELTAFAILMFMVSCVLSFLSMRNINQSSEKYEKLADFIFLAGLFFLFILTSLIVFNIV
jgi:hypothetical protein